MIDKFVKIFLSNDTLIIKDLKKLEEYFEKCLNFKDNPKVVHVTVYHHILPKDKDFFPEFKNLKEHTWNGVHLSRKEHTEVHKILHEAVNHYKMAYAYVSSSIVSNEYENNPKWAEIKVKAWKKWANDTDINGETNFSKVTKKQVETKKETGVYEIWGRKISNFLNEKIEIDGKIASRSTYMNKKGLETKKNTLCHNGLTIHENMIEKRRKWQKTELIGPDGILTTNQREVVKRSIETKKNTKNSEGKNIFQQAGEKTRARLNETVIDIYGNETTKGREAIKHATDCLKSQMNSKSVLYEGREMLLREMISLKISKTKRNKSPKYRVFGTNSPKDLLSRKEITSLQSRLIHTSNDCKLGDFPNIVIQLKKFNKLHMIDWYVELSE